MPKSAAKAPRNELAKHTEKVVKEVLKTTGFVPEKEIYRNYDNSKLDYQIRSLILKGVFGKTPAVLKFHGLKNESQDVEEIEKFNGQNESDLISAPTVLSHRAWVSSKGYGYTIFGYVDAPPIIRSAFPSKEELSDFLRFYQEYKTRAITRPWIKTPRGQDFSSAYRETADLWIRKAKAKERLAERDYIPYYKTLMKLGDAQISQIPAEFMHMHLYPEHILKLDGGKYLLLDHFSWGYRRQWADLSYMFWKTMVGIRDNEFTGADLFDYFKAWRLKLKEIPVVKKDRNFDRKIGLLVLERTIGTIIGDIGSGKFWETTEGQSYFKAALRREQDFFELLSEDYK
jgi:hypothetical protein